MTASKILDLLMSRLGDRREPELRALCLLEMALAQETVLEAGPVLPWFLITEEAVTTTTVNDHRVELPDDFIREVDDGEYPLYYRPADGSSDVVLTKGSFSELRAKNWGERDTPMGYALRGEYLMIFPKPQEEHILVLPGYYARQTPPSDSDSFENVWCKWAPDLLMSVTGEIVAAQHLQNVDPIVVQSFSNIKVEAYNRLSRMETAREEANRDRSMG